jgi:hypothetical protein
MEEHEMLTFEQKLERLRIIIKEDGCKFFRECEQCLTYSTCTGNLNGGYSCSKEAKKTLESIEITMRKIQLWKKMI